MEHKTWNELRDEAHQNSINHGWWKDRPSNEHFMCLIISELMEAVQADRKCKIAQRRMYTINVNTPQTDPEAHRRFIFEKFIKDSVEDELADAMIRIFDLAGGNNVNLNGKICLQHVVTKKKTFTENIYAIVKDLVNSRYDISDKLNYCRMQISKLAEILDIELYWFIEQKMRYNLTREYKHGKEY